MVQCFKKVVFSRLVLVNCLLAQYEYSILCLTDWDIFVEVEELFCEVAGITYRLIELYFHLGPKSKIGFLFTKPDCCSKL